MVRILETKNFIVHAADKPLIDREDGGHICIVPKNSKEHRWQLRTKDAQGLMILSMIVGEAMKKGLNKRGISVERINFQDNGNWSVGTKHRNKVHLHLFGRAKKEKHQKRGESINFPKRKFAFWKRLHALDATDIKAILDEITKLSKTSKYRKIWKSL